MSKEYQIAPEVRQMFEDYSGHPLCGDLAVTIEPGDWYIAQRNGPARILQCKFSNKKNGWIVATSQNAYPYNTHECFRLRKNIDPESIVLLAVEAEETYMTWHNKFWENYRTRALLSF